MAEERDREIYKYLSEKGNVVFSSEFLRYNHPIKASLRKLSALISSMGVEIETFLDHFQKCFDEKEQFDSEWVMENVGEQDNELMEALMSYLEDYREVHNIFLDICRMVHHYTSSESAEMPVIRMLIIDFILKSFGEDKMHLIALVNEYFPDESGQQQTELNNERVLTNYMVDKAATVRGSHKEEDDEVDVGSILNEWEDKDIGEGS